MEVVSLKGHVTYVEYSTKFQVLGTSSQMDDNNYNSVTYITNTDDLIKCGISDGYTLKITDNPNEATPYLLNKIDGIQVDEGFVSYSFSSVSSENVTNTSVKTIVIIIRKDNDLISNWLKIGMTIGLDFSIDGCDK